MVWFTHTNACVGSRGAALTYLMAHASECVSVILCVRRENVKRSERTGMANKVAHEKGLTGCCPLNDRLPWGLLNSSFMPFNRSSIHVWSHQCFSLLSAIVFVTFDPCEPFFEVFYPFFSFFHSLTPLHSLFFPRPDIEMFVGSGMSVVDMVIFNDVFIQAGNPGNSSLTTAHCQYNSLHSSYAGKKRSLFCCFKLHLSLQAQFAGLATPATFS